MKSHHSSLEANSSTPTLTAPTLAERQMTSFFAPPPPASLLQGYDSVNGYGLSIAIDSPAPVDHGGTSSVKYEVCEDTESLYKALEISQSASVSFGPFGSVSEKAEFVQKLNLTSHSLSIVVHARHVKSTKTVTDYKLKSGIEPPVGDDQLRKFFRSYGDSFISSITLGAEYYAVYTYYAQSTEEQLSVSAELKANGIFEFGTVQADLQAKLDNVTKKTQTRISFSQNVAGIANPKLPSPEELVPYALAFPSLPIDSPSVLSYGSTGYEHVSGIDGFEPIAKNRAYLVGNGPVDGLAADLARITKLQNQVEWLKKVYAFYQHFQDPKVTEASKVIDEDIKAVDTQFEAFVTDPVATFTHLKLPALELGSPELTYKIAQSPQQGGNGGDPFDDVDVNTYLQRQTRISVLQLSTGRLVDKLIVTYTAEEGASHTVQHGGGGGGLSNTLQLRAGDFVSKVEGRSGSEVDQLAFTLNDGRSLRGGGGGGGPFSWEVPAGSIVLGFSGRSGDRLDQIKTIYATLEAATWVKN